MKSIAIVALLAVAGVALWKHRLSLTVKGSVGTPTESGGYPSGVSSYTPIVGAQLPQQLLAFRETNPDAVSPLGYAPAFGPGENQPGPGEMVF